MNGRFFRITIKELNKLGWRDTLNSQEENTGFSWPTSKLDTCSKTFVATRFARDGGGRGDYYQIINNRQTFSYVIEWLEVIEEITEKEFYTVLDAYRQSPSAVDYEG